MDTIAQGQRNHLAPLVVGLIRALSLERAAHDSTRTMLHESLTLLHEQDQRLDRERANRLHLLQQYRAAVKGEVIDKQNATLSEHSKAA